MAGMQMDWSDTVVVTNMFRRVFVFFLSLRLVDMRVGKMLPSSLYRHDKRKFSVLHSAWLQPARPVLLICFICRERTEHCELKEKKRPDANKIVCVTFRARL